MRLKLSPYTFFALVLGTAMVARAIPANAGSNSGLTQETEAALEHAMLGADPSGKKAFDESSAIDAIAKPIDAALAQSPTDPALLYTKAFADFAASVPLRWGNQAGSLADRYEKAIALLEKIREGTPWKAEAEAFEGFLITQMIGLKGQEAAMDLWPKADRLLSHAAKALPQSPRVLFFRGHVMWTVPEQVGGNQDKGQALMQASIGAFAGERAAQTSAATSAPGPRWGYAYALGWYGSALKKKGDKQAAAEIWQRTLEVEPHYTFVEQRLLPSLKKKEAKNKKADGEVAVPAKN